MRVVARAALTVAVVAFAAAVAAGVSIAVAIPLGRFARAASAQEPPAALRTVESIDGAMRLRLPAAWAVQTVVADQGAHFKLHVRLTKDDPEIPVWGYVKTGVRNLRALAGLELPWQIRDHSARAHGAGHEPVEHLWTEASGSDGPVKRLWAARVVNRVGLVFVFEVPSKIWDRMLPGALEAVRTADTRRADCWNRPADYRVMQRDGYRYLLHPAAKEKDALALHAVVLDTEREYSKWHGAVPQPPENPIEIVFHDTVGAADALTAQHFRLPWSRFGVYGEPAAGLVVAARLPADGSPARADLRFALSLVLQTQRYQQLPEWVRLMEARGAWMQGACGKPLPVIPESSVALRGPPPTPFADLIRKEWSALLDDTDSLVVYLALFRCGPKEYQAAWTAFHAELAASGDFAAATKILLALDQEELAAAAAAFRDKSLRPVKPGK